MSQTFVIGDIHGGLKALHEVLIAAKIQPQDTLIFLGDYVDGWSDSARLIDYLIDLDQKLNCIFIRGNHDELFLAWLKNNEENQMWQFHGGESTVKAYQNIETLTKNKHIQFLENLQDYHLDSENRLFVHAGFTNQNGVNHEYFSTMFCWDRTLWELAISMDKSLDREHLHYPKRLKLYHEIYIGHTPVTNINQTTPTNYANVWNVDTGAGFKGSLSILNVDTKEYFQSTPVYELYNEEKGRN